MNFKRPGLFILFTALLVGIVALIVFDISLDIFSASAQSPTMGPYDIAVLPLEDVPEPVESVVRRPIASYSGEFATAEVLRVLKDPRTIPLERFIYYKHPSSGIPQNRIGADPEVFEERLQLYDVITHPDADRIIERFSDEAPGAVAVYIRTTGSTYITKIYSEDGMTLLEEIPQPQIDPFYVRDPVRDYEYLFVSDNGGPSEFEPWFPWPVISVADPQSDLSFPCMPNQVLEFSDPYPTPTTNSEFDPSSYLPPKPWYTASDYLMEDGEVREGWLICLAPDIPVDEIEIVRRSGYVYSYSNEPFTSPSGTIWTNLNILQMGEWYILPDQQVIAWNEGPDNRVDEPERLDQTIVFDGDVWISLSTALHYDQVPNRYYTDFEPLNTGLVQFYFDGMDTLLQEWDHLALSETLSLNYCKDFQLSDCMETSNYHSYLFADISEIKALGTWGKLPFETAETDSFVVLPISIVTGAELDSLRSDHIYKGRIPAWTVTPQNVDMPLLTTHEICEHTECIPEDIIHLDYDGEPLDTQLIHLFDGPIPIIPFGESANGIQIVNSSIYNGPILTRRANYSLDLILTGVHVPRGYKDYQDLFVELSSQADYHNFRLYSYNGTYLQYHYGSRYSFYNNNGSWPAYYPNWLTQIRGSITTTTIYEDLLAGTPITNFYLIVHNRSDGGGPAYEIE